MIIRGGENIYPREIEEFLYTHPQDRRRAGRRSARRAVRRGGHGLGPPQAQRGRHRRIRRDFCRGRIAHYKVPRYVKFTDEFPMTVTGKIQKFRMREMAVEELGLQAASRIERRELN